MGTIFYNDQPFGGGYDPGVYRVSDAAETDLQDADYIPFYDHSATAKKKSLWSNIKAKLKDYFDGLYSAVGHTHTKSSITDFPTLATVATSGSYNDLGNKPTIPTVPGVVSKSGNGLAPKLPNETATTKYLRQDGTWQVPPDNNTWTAMQGATIASNGSVGYVNAVPPKDGYNTKFLRADGTWAVPPNGKLTIQRNGTNIATFTANSSSNVTVNIPSHYLDRIMLNNGASLGTYTHAKLLAQLRNNSNVLPRTMCHYTCPFDGGDRFGFCYLYEGTKEYGMVMVFHYSSQPVYLQVIGGTTYAVNWTT